MTGPDRGRTATVVAVMLGIALVLMLAAVVASLLSARREVARFEQPATITYPDGRDPHVAVVFVDRSWLGAAFGVDGRRTVTMGSDPSGTYGHPVTLDTLGDGSQELVEVRWEPAGAWLAYRSGHRVFVPARFFLGGR